MRTNIAALSGSHFHDLPGHLPVSTEPNAGDDKPSEPEITPEEDPERLERIREGRPRILISDEHGVYRLGLSLTLKTAFTDWDVVDAGSLTEATSLMREGQPTELALLDVSGPGWAAQVRDVLRFAPETRFMLLMPLNSRELVLEAIATGMHGAVSKVQSDDEIILAVSDVLSGRIYVPPWMADPMDDASESDDPKAPRERGRAKTQLSLLTPRQKEVFILVSEGLSNREIAQALNISEATAKIHVAAVFRTVRVRNRTEAALLARKWLEG
ncbi:LuxR C-terminal-related transcriptional regulator [Enterovirga sp. CN4-39]|uniref:LuxR C-terminal-related transcriptional regulator n=1 Tax=Enterovirga sp. CN4-39 TaxID=3400910 RepID=UPI003BFC9CE2